MVLMCVDKRGKESFFLVLLTALSQTTYYLGMVKFRKWSSLAILLL